MIDDPRRHIAAIAGRTESESQHLVAFMQRTCWPGGSQDRRDPTALAWVRRWRPGRAGAEIPVCSCAQGRCVVCN
ncbi:MAG TPA: hypothetical protein VK501_00880 [Baekduia sp.]|uniref:hypothetical protein n=1 Tax=Baekduia sp. TaxID=2600305 RepID=UPI002C15DF20|nr:hypothetical protein [Baekduia sp.]HMJ32440.1 hypothetical protein [Baekduia sp.]